MKAILLSTASAMVLVVLPQAAAAQNAASTSGDAGLEEIVVTAQRKAESAQKAALAISVVSSEAMLSAGVTNATTLNAVAPSLNVSQGGGANSAYFVRGVGNFTNNAYSDPAVAFNYDGIYIGRPTATGSAFFDLERIEVLKGPQGTLYGRNATGGAINVIPARPVLGELSGALTLGYGNYSAFDGEAMLNLPIGRSTALRLSGKVLAADGFNSDGTSDSKSQAIRAQLLTEPSDTLTLRLAGDYAHNGGMGMGASYNGALHFAPGAPASATAPANYVFAPAGVGPRSGMLSPEGRQFFSQQLIGGSFNFPAPLDTPSIDDQNWGILGQADWKTGAGTLTAVAAYREASLDDLFNGPPSFRGARILENSHQFSAEARFEGERIGPIEWLVGAYYYDETVKGGASFSQYLLASIQEYDVNTKSLAGFGRLTFHASDALRFVAAGRYTHDTKRFDGQAISLLNICTTPFPTGPGCFGGPSLPSGLTLGDFAAAIPASDLPFGFPPAPGPANARPFGSAGNILFYVPTTVNDRLQNNRFTYRLAAEYDVGPNSLAYVSYETGYRSGGFGLAAGHETFKPEYLNAFTVGLKNRFLNNRLQINLEAFWWKYKDQQISHFGFDALGLSNFFIENAGSSTIKGVDVDIQFKATPTTLLSGSVQFLDNKLDDFTYNVPGDATSLPPAVGCPFTPATDAAGLPVYTVNCAGKPGFNSPRWSINFGIRQDIPIGNYNIRLSGDGRYRSNSVIGFDYLAQHNSGSTFTADASAAFGPQDGQWLLTAWIRNLTDENVPTITQFNATVGGVIATAYAPPRTYGLRGTFKF
jgi:iron complex outermembrane recepter protein